MNIEYEINGIKLTGSDMCNIDKYYEAACSAEYIQDNYELAKLSDELALELGYDVRRLMDKYNYCEDEAISQITAEFETEINDVLLEWLEEHKLVWEDFENHYKDKLFDKGLDGVCDLPLEEVLGWISEHKTLCDDLQVHANSESDIFDSLTASFIKCWIERKQENEKED